VNAGWNLDSGRKHKPIDTQHFSPLKPIILMFTGGFSYHLRIIIIP